LPKALIGDVKAVAKQIKRTESELVREAIALGLDVIRGEKPVRGRYLPSGLRPPHAAQIHEAGHAVAVILMAESLEDQKAFVEGTDMEDVLRSVTLKPQGGGHCTHLPLPPLHDLRIVIAGAVAEAKAKARSFDEIWNDDCCRLDRRSAKRLKCTQDEFNEAVKDMSAAFDNLHNWAGLICLAESLLYGKTPGSKCWDDFRFGWLESYGRHEQPQAAE
jgi:hypothetical protein